MVTEVEKLAADIARYWKEWWISGGARAEIVGLRHPYKVQIQLTDDEGCVYLHDGVVIEWIGECSWNRPMHRVERTPPLVKVNNVIIEASPEQIVSLLVGQGCDT